MRKLLFALITVFSFEAYSQSLPWPDGQPCGRHVGLNLSGKFLQNFTQYNWYSNAWREIIDLMATLYNKPDLKLSFEYVQYRVGYQVMTAADYATECDAFPDLDQDIQDLLRLQETRPLVSDDFKGPRWIHTIQAIDIQEANCLALSRINGKIAGCGDLWQDGITEDEAVCYKGKTYLRCHINCLNKIYNRQAKVESGYCK